MSIFVGNDKIINVRSIDGVQIFRRQMFINNSY